MSWTPISAASAIALLTIVVAGAIVVEKRITEGRLSLAGYSFQRMWRFVAASSLLVAVLMIAIYLWTADLTWSLEWGAILLAICVAGWVRGFLNEYHLKKRGGKNLDKQ
jgi:hypothetical protein